MSIDFSTLAVGEKRFIDGVSDWNTSSRVHYDAAVKYGAENGTQYQFDREQIGPKEYRWFVERLK